MSGQRGEDHEVRTLIEEGVSLPTKKLLDSERKTMPILCREGSDMAKYVQDHTPINVLLNELYSGDNDQFYSRDAVIRILEVLSESDEIRLPHQEIIKKG